MHRIGLIGAGWISEAHARGWETVPDRAEVVAVADVDEEAAARLATRFSAKAYSDYRSLLDEASADAVDVCLPPHLHSQVVPELARRGIDVLCEKPVARDLAEADAIGAVVRAAGIKYLPAHNSLFYPPVERAREYLRRGDLGPLFHLRSWDCDSDLGPARFGASRTPPEQRPGEDWRGSPSTLGGGALIDGGFHAIYRLLYLAPYGVTEVSAMIGQFHPDLGWESEDTAALLLRFEDGSLGEVVISYAFDAPTTGTDRLFTAVGREGVLSGNESDLQLRLGKWSTPSVQNLSKLQGESAWYETFRLEINHFLDVIEGRAAPIQTYLDARRALGVVRAAYESAETGRTVQLPDVKGDQTT